MNSAAHRAARTVLCALAALAVAAPAGAATYRVCGRQIAVDADNGIFKMKGSLVGDWNITASNQTATPLLEANGTETFRGCPDVRRNGCDRRDPRGTLNFTFTYQALFASPTPPRWCGAPAGTRSSPGPAASPAPGA